MNYEKIRSAFLPKADAAIITSEVNRQYFTRFPATDGYLLITADEVLLFADSRYIEAAQRSAKNCDRILLYKGIEESLKPVLEQKGIKSLEAESDRLTVSELRSLREKTGVDIVSEGGLDKAVDALRAVKDEEEISLIKQAQKIAENAFSHILGFISTDRTEKEIALELDYYMLSHGADGISFETIAVSGANSSLPHGVPSDKKIENGDFITMDFGAVVGGYHSDMTRTVAVGSVSEEQKRVYDTVLAAQHAGFSRLMPGVCARDADAAARDVISQAGYGQYFGHSLGHGVGVEIHEKPNLSPKSAAVLEKGNVVTNEPGIYIPGSFGVRIEDMALITEDGYENLTCCEKKLIIL
ncbi:MAG: aminopeptidase P family protein [Clostridia bacterium]|nr:aminopeptidase P family protein [Clostridia bacterium]